MLGTGVSFEPPIRGHHRGIYIFFNAATIFMCSQKGINLVTPAKAGVQKRQRILDSGFRRNDAVGYPYK